MTPWWRTAVFYQIYPRSFQDTDGDGIGDLRGIERRLDHLVDLGVDVLWLSPIHPSPQADFGYDISDYEGVDPLFGTLDDFDRLLASAHDRGLRLILDGVFNHTSDRHPWFLESRLGRGSAKRDWYLWRDVPNNWASTFGGSGWSRDAVTGQSWFHSFLPEQPDLNWRNPEVVRAVLESMRFWFDRGVDGFRLDVFNCYLKHPDLRDNPRRWHPGGLFYPYIGQHHVHDRDQPDLNDVALAPMRALADSYGAVLVGETLDENFRYDRAADYVGAGRLHMDFHFALLHSRWSADRLLAAIRRQVDALPPDGWPTWVLSNHDFARHPTRWGGGDARAKAAAVLALCLRGTPFLYYGEEIGMVEGRLRRDQIVDPPGKRFWPFFKGRDGARTPMQWDGSRGAGFTTGTPWLPPNADADPRNVAEQGTDSDSVLATYRRLLALRRQHEALRTGAMTDLRAEHGVLTWRREAHDAVVIAVNTTSRRQRWDAPIGAECLFRTGNGDAGSLLADEAGIWRL